MLPPFTDTQLRILLVALEYFQAAVAADLNGWTIGPSNQNDIEPLLGNVQIDVECDELRQVLQQEIH